MSFLVDPDPQHSTKSSLFKLRQFSYIYITWYNLIKAQYHVLLNNVPYVFPRPMNENLVKSLTTYPVHVQEPSGASALLCWL
jgi:hypothetical protein